MTGKREAVRAESKSFFRSSRGEDVGAFLLALLIALGMVLWK